MNSDTTHGLTLKFLRSIRRIRQFEIAAACGVHESTVCKWETGRAAIPEEHLPAICSAMGITTDQFRRMASAFEDMAVTHPPALNRRRVTPC